MCGIVGIVSNGSVNQCIFDCLTVLQHRGQDAAGIVTQHKKRFYSRKNNGMVRDVFRTKHMSRLVGNMGIGHVRYPTAGSSSSAEAQPFYVNSPYGVVLAHNGNLVNTQEVAQELFEMDRRHINTNSDSEVLLNVVAHELQEVSDKDFLSPKRIFSAFKGVYKRCKGGFAAVAMISGSGMIGFRDPNGIRPLCIGFRETEDGTDYMLASESVALTTSGFELLRDVKAGEVIYITPTGELHSEICAEQVNLSPCIFEYVYLARPDSIMDDISIYKARLRMGEKLAKRILKQWPDNDIDVVIPIPDTSRTSALEMAHSLNVPYREGFIKNRYIGRTFIMPGQETRKKSVRQKLSAIELEFKGKNVLLVDDSIVRGTTCNEIIQMARQAGAKKVYFASAAPAIRFPNIYGIDMPVKEELIAHNRTVEDIAEKIGADGLLYQDLDDLVAAVQEGNKSISGFDCSVFNGEYIAGNINEQYFQNLATQRNDKAKRKKLDQQLMQELST